ncbi:uracil-DNA glycosylase family protein [Aurantimonas sp. Leaf443]|uniref:uracil-DNA glycosylase family protein n=1 Tax=Aurantimonas sp. Leaf443 TaxID=1736378 RepID=UPI0006F31A0E|nr:uracil-DNA glycosylase family protein [Aurantimonas sp. Leaf443]KQT88263.1 DNA polymerase [Aurantimonas sp. Leaf443]
MTARPLSAADTEAALALLAWWSEAGLGTIVQETARDRLAETRAEIEARRARRGEAETAREPMTARPAPQPRAERPAAEPQRESAAPRVAVPGDLAVADARARAASAQTLDELRAALEAFDGCNLRISARSTVFGDGPDAARIMIVGEAPGREEDQAGMPFVGRSGRLLDRMLAAIGVDRSAVRVTNTVPWRPPGNRPPTPAETQACLPFLQRHIELVRPQILLCLGSPAVKALLGSDEGILRLRGRWQTYAFDVTCEASVAVMPMLHPAYLLRQPAQKRLAWRDLMAVKARLDETATAD